jgi:UDP-N-acetylmuramyl pentapeptide phosphotransferase/UDP-N-acetylglucosamine-1-phosphate transferase
MKRYEVNLLRKNLRLKIVPKTNKLFYHTLNAMIQVIYLFSFYTYFFEDSKKQMLKKYLTYIYYKMKKLIIVYMCMEIKG